MDFNNIKMKMESESMENLKVPRAMEDIDSSRMPIRQVRKSMRQEILTQLLCILLFFAAPFFVPMHELPKSVYYLLMLITSLITLGYLAKMTWFLNNSSNLNQGSKDAIMGFINDLKLTLEVYKTAIIAGSLLLPFSVSTLVLGIRQLDEKLFTNVLLLNIPAFWIIIMVFGYIIFSVLIYFVTVAWSDKLYGSHIKTLEKTLKEFDN